MQLVSNTARRVRFSAKREHLERVYRLVSESQGQNPALTVLYVPCLLDSGGVTALGARGNPLGGGRVPRGRAASFPHRYPRQVTAHCRWVTAYSLVDVEGVWYKSVNFARLVEGALRGVEPLVSNAVPLIG